MRQSSMTHATQQSPSGLGTLQGATVRVLAEGHVH